MGGRADNVKSQTLDLKLWNNLEQLSMVLDAPPPPPPTPTPALWHVCSPACQCHQARCPGMWDSVPRSCEESMAVEASGVRKEFARSVGTTEASGCTVPRARPIISNPRPAQCYMDQAKHHCQPTTTPQRTEANGEGSCPPPRAPDTEQWDRDSPGAPLAQPPEGREGGV